MPNYPAIAALTTAALAALLLTSTPAPVPTAPAPVPASSSSPSAAPVGPSVTAPAVVSYLPCPQEDYEGPVACRWDAAVRSNGAGFSFTWDGNHTHYETTGVVACPSADYVGMQPCYWAGNGTGAAYLWTGHGKIRTN